MSCALLLATHNIFSLKKEKQMNIILLKFILVHSVHSRCFQFSIFIMMITFIQMFIIHDNVQSKELGVKGRGYCTPIQKLACFVLYLKIINTFLKNEISTLN